MVAPGAIPVYRDIDWARSAGLTQRTWAGAGKRTPRRLQQPAANGALLRSTAANAAPAKGAASRRTRRRDWTTAGYTRTGEGFPGLPQRLAHAAPGWRQPARERREQR